MRIYKYADMVYQFKIQLEGVSKPPVWRKVEVPANFTFEQLHKVIQIVFGWGDYHLWRFEPHAKGYRHPAFRIEHSDPEDVFGSDWFAERLEPDETRLDQIIPVTPNLVYLYDFGDDWKHLIKLEGILDEDRSRAVLVKGKGATPPEDCGGVWGYEDMKAAFANGDKEEAQSYREWLGLDDDDDWDPNFFCEEEQKDIALQLRGICCASEAKADEPRRELSIDDIAVVHGFKSKHSSSPVYYSIQEVLESFTVVRLRELAAKLGLKIKSGVKKSNMLEWIAGLMLSHPELIVEASFYYELKAYLDIIEGKMSVEHAEESGLLFDLNRFGLIYAVDNRRDNSSSLHLQMDMADLLAPLIRAELERRGGDSLKLEKLIFGHVNIYGYAEISTIDDLLEEIEKYIGHQISDEDLMDILFPFVVEYGSGKKEQVLILSPFAKQVGFFPDEDHIRFEVLPKFFDTDTIMEYGEMPYPKFTGKEADALRKAIIKGQNGVSPDAIMRRLWLEHQEIVMPNPAHCIDDIGVDPKDLQSCLDAIKGFVNSVPCWKFGGNSSVEVFEKYKPKMPFVRPQHKIGRNDPCFCGSGKKYKNCCGR